MENNQTLFGTISNEGRPQTLELSKTSSVADTETLIAMINGDRFATTKQHLVNVLPLVKAAELAGGGRHDWCENCNAFESSRGDTISLVMEEPAWSNCADCDLK